VFAHGSGSSGHSPGNRYVADVLNEGALATLLIGLLTADEQELDLQTSQLRFDVPFLANRLVAITRSLRNQPQMAGLKVGYFGASTGAAAALMAAAELPGLIAAVVSRGGRPDLAGGALERVDAPTLAIVGANDRVVLELNRKALARMNCEGIACYSRRESSVRGTRRFGGGRETGASLVYQRVPLAALRSTQNSCFLDLGQLTAGDGGPGAGGVQRQVRLPVTHGL